MMNDQRRIGTLRYIVPNLRHRWPKELSVFSDTAIAMAYEDFSISDDFGNNDEKFPEWFDVIKSNMDKL